LFTRVSSVFDRLAASPTTVGFGSHFVCSARRCSPKPPWFAHAPETGSPRNGYNDKGQRCPLRVWTSSTGKTGMEPAIAGAPKTCEFVRRLGSHPHPLYPFVGTPIRLTTSQEFGFFNQSCHRLRAFSLLAHPPRPGTFRFTTAETATGVDTGCGATGFTVAPLYREVQS
jgi:hypothetical protein